MPLESSAQDRLYQRCAQAITEAGHERESLFLARLALLLFQEVGDEQRCLRALEQALAELPTPSLSAS
ncbi:MAG: hypothetical protein RL513_1876 [Pseudomonadota bacterium]|jgi:hypothetical protein